MHFSTKMKKNLFKKIEIPEGVEVIVEGTNVIVKKNDNKNQRDFDLRSLILEKKDNELIIGNPKSSKNQKKMINTIASHIRNMIKGVQEKYEYKLKICFVHFPITVEVKGKEAIIKNFLGERFPRKLNIPNGAEVKVDKELITVISSNKELAGQVAANFENVTRIPNRDRRIFQDGIFITNKCGEEI